MNLLIENANNLQKETNDLIAKMQLNDKLTPIGELKLVGSATYNLMTWRDVDFDLVTPAIPDNDIYLKAVKSLFETSGVRKVTLVDNRNQKEKDRPKSMYIGLSYEDEKGEIWKFDIRLLSKESVTTNIIENLIKSKLTDNLRVCILDIKSQVHNNPKYHKGFSSVDIYNAVLLNGVTDIDGFVKYLATLGKSL